MSDALELSAIEAALAKMTPGEWTYRNTVGAGLEIFADVGAALGDAFASMMIYGFVEKPPRFQIGYERWVQFPQRDWDEMQLANAAGIALLRNVAPRLVDEIRTIRARLAKAEAVADLVVSDLQWIVDSYGDVVCPECRSAQELGHDPSCRVGSALSAWKEGA